MEEEKIYWVPAAKRLQGVQEPNARLVAVQAVLGPSLDAPSTHTISNIVLVYPVKEVREDEIESYHLATCQRHYLA